MNQGDDPKILPTEWRRVIMEQPDWENILRRFAERSAVDGVDIITDRIFAMWRATGEFDRPGWWDRERDSMTRGGAWDPTSHRLSVDWLTDFLYRGMVQDMTFGEIAVIMAGEVRRLDALQQGFDPDVRPPDSTP